MVESLSSTQSVVRLGDLLSRDTEVLFLQLQICIVQSGCEAGPSRVVVRLISFFYVKVSLVLYCELKLCCSAGPFPYEEYGGF